ncbi:hypothetical protein HpMMM16_13000 [Helicobacter pylori]
MFDNNDFKDYRKLLGFGSQNAFKEFLGAKDNNLALISMI